MEDKELKKELDKVPDVDIHGEPIFKIDDEYKKRVDEDQAAKDAEENEGGKTNQRILRK